jgi:LruC domain-containing protein
MKHKKTVITILSVLMMISCGDNDYFDQVKYEQLLAEAFPITAIDPAQNWQMHDDLQAKIKIDLQAGETYKVNICASDPMTTDSPRSLVSVDIANGDSAVVAFSTPKADSILYVAISDSKDHVMVKAVGVTGEGINVAFGVQHGDVHSHEGEDPGKMPAKVMSKAIATGNALQHGHSTDGGFTIGAMTRPDVSSYASGTEVNATNIQTTSSTRRFRISGNYTGTVPKIAMDGTASNPVVIYVTGTWTIDSDQRIGGHNIVVVANGGKIVVQQSGILQTNWTQYTSDAASIIVMNGGEISGASTLYMRNGGVIYNGGTINVSTLGNNGGLVYNADAATLMANSVEGNADKSYFVNAGTFAADKLTGNGVVVRNACRMEISGEMQLGGTDNSVNANGAYIQCGSLSATGSGSSLNRRIFMGNNSIMRVLGAMSLNNYGIQGPCHYSTSANGYAFVTFGYISYANYTAGSYGVITDGAVTGYLVLNHSNNTQQANYQWAYDNFTKGMVSAASWGQRDAGTLWRRNYTYYYNYYDKDPCFDKAVYGSGAPYTIESSTCSAGIREGAKKITYETFDWRYCFEDNFPVPGDYDFNDIVMSFEGTKYYSGTSYNRKISYTNLRVRLDAVGATKQLAAALHLSGIKAENIKSVSFLQGSADFGGDQRILTSPASGNYTICGISGSSAYNEVVIPLFNDAHYFISGGRKNANGLVDRFFYNTVKDDQESGIAREVTPREIQIHIEFNNVTDLRASDFDLFIIEQYNGNNWEVHTYPYKKVEVLSSFLSNQSRYSDVYNDPYPWAILVPGTFRYPKEWTPVGSYRDNIIGGAYRSPGRSFGEWARDHNVATLWYNYPDESLVY